MNYPAAELRGIKPLKIEKRELASMNLPVCTALLLNIFFNHFLITVLAYRVRVVSARPELTAPEHLLHFGVYAKDFLCRDALDDLDNCLWGHHGDTLNEKVDMVFICPNLHEMDLMSFPDPRTYLLQSIFDVFRKDLPSVLRRADDVVEQEGLVVSLENMFAHPSILAEAAVSGDTFKKGIRAAELRGMF
jgi:hypothetical protein